MALEQATPREVGAVRRPWPGCPCCRNCCPSSSPPWWPRRPATWTDLPEPQDLIGRALVEDPPATLQAGGIIREGYDAELDELIQPSTGRGRTGSPAWRPRSGRRTGINSLKVRYNKVFGYYLEVSRANLHLVPADYTRKQTLVNAERFITADLKEYESRVLGAEEARLKRETELFQELRRRLRRGDPPPQAGGPGPGPILDVGAALAELAALHQY